MSAAIAENQKPVAVMSAAITENQKQTLNMRKIMTDKQNPKDDDDDFDFSDPVLSNDFNFVLTEEDIRAANNLRENVIKKQSTINEKEAEKRAMAAAEAVKENTITEKEIKDHEEDDFDNFDFGIGNAAAEETIEDDDVTDEDILNTMTYYVATYAKSVGGKKTIFKRFMDISRETDSHGNKNIAAMILFLTDLINGISDQDYFGNALDENKQEYMQAFAASIVFLAENRNWK
ncbi:hypothetical protein [Pseudomonas viridiflava]|uniref:hypothetical protein n=1 Tax=Pseudomonas viridiflava TaxID=33069 RepID=UPI001C312088|nr:hypothetical protein [Pseudomonas viridiflava]QXG47593.1 hypothetical protein KTT57_00485 [Pseudomonas viridiflava]